MFRRVGVLTGGGDVPGINGAVQSLAWRLVDGGREVVGLRRGWASLLHAGPGRDPGDWVVNLDRDATRDLDRVGENLLHTSRLNPSRLKPNQVPEHLAAGAPAATEEGTIDLTSAALEAVGHLELDAVVAIGGDGTLSFAGHLAGQGVPVVAIPKTMDNDVYGTDYSLGFSTAVTRAVRSINDLRTAAASHERYLVVELFGRYSGEPCVLASYLSRADRALLAEVPYDADRVAELLREDKLANPSRYAVLTVSEGAHPIGGEPLERGAADAVGHRKLGGIGGRIAQDLEARTGERALYQPLGYLMRSGLPDSLDQLVARNFGGLAADLLLEGRSGLLAAIVGGRYTAVGIERLGEGIRRVDVDRFYDRDVYRAKVTDIMSLPMFLH